MSQGPRARARRHDWIDQRSLAFGQAIGEKLRADPSVVADSRQRQAEWRADAVERGDHRIQPVLDEWYQLLHTLSVDALVELLSVDQSERATRLRQSWPFVGLLTEQERAAIMARFEAL